MQPEYPDGTVGLRRLTRVSSAATPVAWVATDDIIEVSDLDHHLEDVQNVYVLWWNWNGEKFTRRNVLYDATSANIHNKVTKIVELKFRGLHGSRITLNRIEQLLDLKRDRYGARPSAASLTMRARRMPLDVAEIIRAQIPSFATSRAAAPISTAPSSVRASPRLARPAGAGEALRPTAPIRPRPPQSAVTALADGFSSVGTALGSVSGVTITGGVLTAAPSGDITGGDLNTADAVLYHLGDLTIASGVDLKIAENIELRVRGALTVNGKINGKGRGYAGVTDTGGTVGLQGRRPRRPPLAQPASSAPRRASDGLRAFDEGSHRHVRGNYSNPAPLAAAACERARAHGGAPVGNYLTGIPDDLRGTSGGARRPTLGATGKATSRPEAPRAGGRAGLSSSAAGSSSSLRRDRPLWRRRLGADASGPAHRSAACRDTRAPAAAGIPAPATSSSTATTSRCPT